MKVTHVCFSQCLMACLNMARWLPEEGQHISKMHAAPGGLPAASSSGGQELGSSDATTVVSQ